VQVIVWKDSSPKWPVTCRAGRKTPLSHWGRCCLGQCCDGGTFDCSLCLLSHKMKRANRH